MKIRFLMYNVSGLQTSWQVTWNGNNFRNLIIKLFVNIFVDLTISFKWI